MVGRDNVTFVFSIENRKFMVKGKQMGSMLTEIQRSSTGASQGLRTVGDTSQNAGTKMAASAVNFQTATTGLLNLSTATVQTYTSISNLARANNRAEMSIIAVARAEDLLNNKEARLNDLRAQGIKSGEKYRNMQREIATATADLAVKQDKQRIEQDAVNDVYMLFATNIANVTISSLQTIGVLLGQERMARLGVAAATKLQSLALSRNVSMMVASKGAIAGQVLWTSKLTFAQIKTIATTKGLTAATIAFTRAAWPLLAVSAAVSAAYLIYDNNVLGVKDSIDELMGSEKTHLDLLDEERSEIDSLNDSLDTHTEKIFKLPNTYAKAAEDLKKLKNQIKETNEALKDTPLFREASVAGGKPTATGFSILPMAFADHGGAHYDHEFDRFELFDRFAPKIQGEYGTYRNPFPQERLGPQFGYGPMSKFDFKTHAINIYGSGSGSFSTTGKPTAFTSEGRPMGTAGTKIQEEFLEFETRSLIQQMADIQGIEFSQAQEDFEKGNIKFLPNELQGKIRTHFEKREAVIQRLHGKGFVQNEIEQKTILAGLKQYSPESYALEQHKQTVKEEMAEIKKQEEKEFKLEAESMHLTPKELKKRQDILFLAGSFQHKQRLKGGYFTTRTLTAADKRLMEQIGAVIDVAGVGNVFTPEKARIAKEKRKSLLQGDTSSLPTDTAFDRLVKDTFLQSHKIGGSGKIFDTKKLKMMLESDDFSPSRKAAYDKYGVDIGKIGDVISKVDAERFGMYQAVGNALNNQVGGQQYTNLFNSFGGSATAAYQVANVATPKSIRNAIRNKDGFNNSLGGLIMNELNSLKGSGQMVYSSAHRSLYKSRNFRGVPGRDVIREAVRLGIKGNVEFMDMINAIPDVDREADDNIQQAHAAIRQAETIANDYISMVNSAKSSIGFSDVILRRATAEGHSGASMYANIGLLSATKRTNFNNTEIIEQSKSKLALTNSQIFAIRFNSTRGDAELQDRLRYVDQLESMSSGTSPL